MNGRDAAGPSPFQARRRGEHLQRQRLRRCAGVTVMGMCSPRHSTSEILDTLSRSRGAFRPSFASSRHPRWKEGAGKTGCRPGTHGPLCERWQQEFAQRHTGEAKHPAFPAQWVYGLCRALPGERCTVAPVALRLTMRAPGWTARITATLDASLRAPGPHDFAVRRSHRSCARRISLTVARPAMPFAPM
jgi:hypothetical protein